MKVFSPQSKAQSLNFKVNHNKAELDALNTEITLKLRERNELAKTIDELRENQVKQLETAIQPLIAQKKELELEVSNLEARRKIALSPLTDMKRRLAKWQKELLDKEDMLEYGRVSLEEKETYLNYRQKRIDDVDKDIRNKRIWLKREIRDQERKSEETAYYHEKAKKAHDEAVYREKEAKEELQRVLKYKKNVDEDQRAYRAMLDEQKVRLDREYAKIASDRAKLKAALDYQKQYASKGCKQCKTSNGSQLSNRRSKAGKN